MQRRRRTEGNSLAHKVQKDTNHWNDEEASVSGKRGVPSSRHRVDVESLLGKLSRIATEHDGRRSVTERIQHQNPEDPGDLEDLVDVQSLALLDQLLSSDGIDAVAKLLAGLFVEPVERC